MLRPLFAHALSPSRNLRLPTRIIQCRALTLPPNPRLPGSGMFDVLQILGPIDALFPPQASQAYTSLLRKCIRGRDTRHGASIHALMVKSGSLLAEPVAPNALLDFYGKSGLLQECFQLFEEMPLRDMVSWCTLISGLSRHGLGFDAFEVFRGIIRSGLVPNRFVFSSVLVGCSATETLELGLQVHGHITRCGTGFDYYVQIGLVDMYSKCGSLDDALRVFYEIPIKASVSWNAMLSGYAHNGFFMDTVRLFIDFYRSGTFLDSTTLRIVAYAASALDMYLFCRNLQAYSIKIGLDKDSYVVTELAKPLAKHGDVDEMEKLFKVVKKPGPSLLSLLISGYNVNNDRAEAVAVAKELLSFGSTPSEGTLANLFNMALNRQEGTQIHARILKVGGEAYTSVSNAVISMYCRFKMLKYAGIVHRTMPAKDIVSWTVLMAGYVHNSHFRKALRIFFDFLRAGITLDQRCAVTVINACSGLRTVSLGMQIHALTLRLNINDSEHLAASLLHMYCKCGKIGIAANLFSHMLPPRGLVPINIMLAGYCCNLCQGRALEVFHWEYNMGFIPDGFTYSAVLSACSDLRLMKVGGQIHSRVTKSGHDCSDDIVRNTLINLYIRSRDVLGASNFFHSSGLAIPLPNNVLVLDESRRMAYGLLLHMIQRDSLKTGNGLVSILRVCTELDASVMGKILHAWILKLGHGSDVCISRSLLEMHEKFSKTCEVSEIFCELPASDTKQCIGSTTHETAVVEEMVEPTVLEDKTQCLLDYFSFSRIHAMTYTLLRKPCNLIQSF